MRCRLPALRLTDKFEVIHAVRDRSVNHDGQDDDCHCLINDIHERWYRVFAAQDAVVGDRPQLLNVVVCPTRVLEVSDLAFASCARRVRATALAAQREWCAIVVVAALAHQIAQLLP